jgi:hypothetical protein
MDFVFGCFSPVTGMKFDIPPAFASEFLDEH